MHVENTPERTVSHHVNQQDARLSRKPVDFGQLIFTGLLVALLIINVRLVAISSQLDSNVRQLRDLLSLNTISANENNADPIAVTWQDSAVRGDPDAPVKIVIFSDFRCPYCAQAVSLFETIFKEYDQRIMLAYRHFPAPNDPEAMLAANAAECAREQDKFWEMHDLLFANQPSLNMRQYSEYATQLGMEVTSFNQCVSEDRYRARIEKDREDALRYGLRGTPTFFINGRVVVGLSNAATVREIIDRELATHQEAE